jgi:hypothetical protein
MQRIELVLTTALVLAGAAVAQAPDPRQEPPRKIVRPAGISVDDMVERIMAFDKNKDGKVTKDELPERMQFLIKLGDTNKDGALDKDEIRKLVAALATTPTGFGNGGFRPDFGPGPGAAGGIRVGGALPPGPDSIEGIVEDLKLPDKKKGRALAAVKAHEEHVAKLMEQARAELLQKMKKILSAEEFEDFKAALNRPRGGTLFLNLGLDAPRPGNVERRADPARK